MDPSEVLARLVKHYLTSRDFNGMSARDLPDYRGALEQLIVAGDIEVFSELNSVNPAIRMVPSARTPDEMVADLRRESPYTWVYPSSQAMRAEDLSRFRDEPYCLRLAEGGAQLDFVYFTFEVLEPYRNDPRFYYRPWDFGSAVGWRGADDDPHAVRDGIGEVRVGFAYSDFEPDAPRVVRLACSILRDLAHLTPAHQQRWKTWEVASQGANPHPGWYASVVGEWNDWIGPFRKLAAEMKALNQLFARAFGENLFETTELPESLGWVLRPTVAEWEAFTLTLDKFLSDNLRPRAFDAARVPRVDNEGREMNTIRRFQYLLDSRVRVRQGSTDEALAPWRRVRRARQDPAHRLGVNSTNESVVREQADLLSDVAWSVESLRRLFMTHRANVGWEPPAELSARVFRF